MVQESWAYLFEIKDTGGAILFFLNKVYFAFAYGFDSALTSESLLLSTLD